MKVLLVEDDASLREGMGEVISDLAEVREAGSVAAALAAIQKERFDLVMTDLRIAGTPQGGRTILEAARQRLQPVAIVSAAEEDELRQVLKPFEADAVLAKPFQLEDMMALIERFLGLRTELERRARERPPASGWEEPAAGVQVLRGPGASSERASAWIRMQPGASYSWPLHQGRAAMLVVDGDLEVGGERQLAPQYLFLSQSPLPTTRTEQGCLVLSLALGG